MSSTRWFDRTCAFTSEPNRSDVGVGGKTCGGMCSWRPRYSKSIGPSAWSSLDAESCQARSFATRFSGMLGTKFPIT